MRAGRNADSPRRTYVQILGFEFRVVMENLNSPVAAIINESMPFAVRRDSHAFPEIEVVRELEEVRHRLVGNFRNALYLGFQRQLGRSKRLCIGVVRRCKQSNHQSANHQALLHKATTSGV